MSNKRKKLEKRADELGLTYVPDTSDEDLEQLINDFDETDEQSEEQDDDNADTKYYRSRTVPGLSVQIGFEPERDEQPLEVRFTPYEYRDDNKGEWVRVGMLATDESDAQEILDDDPNVEEISKKEYYDFVGKNRRAKRQIKK